MTPDARIGTVLAGCRIESVVGRGGMGVVYLAEHMHLRRKVALKLLPAELAEDEGFRERFVRESRLAATIDHPNVIPVYDAGEADGLLYISMRYVEGQDLSALIRREAPFSTDRAIRVIELIAAALDAAHSEGLVHRDVKPGNVLIGRDGHVYLTDFGLTKRSDSQTSLTGTGLVVGTVSYMAPEQFLAGELDARTDVYSLGCVLYECLTGVVAFKRETEAATMYAHLSEPPPRPSERRPELPLSLDAVIERALAKDKENRFRSCGELARAMQTTTLNGRPGSGEGVTAPMLTGGPRKGPRGAPILRRRVLLAAGAALIAMIAALVILRPDTPRAPGPITGSGTPAITYLVFEGSLFRVEARRGAEPEDLAPRLAALSKGRIDEWVNLSANGNWTLLSTDRFGCDHYPCLVIADAELRSAEVVRVEGEPQHGVFGAVSSDGQQIVYSTADGPNGQDLWIVHRGRTEWSEPLLLTQDANEWNGFPTFSRDETRIAFECGPSPDTTEGSAICEVRTDGSGFRVVLAPRDGPNGTSRNSLTHPSYGPDGALYFEGDWGRSGDQVWRLDEGSGEPTRVTTEGRNYSPCVLADGRIATIQEGRRGGPGDPEIVIVPRDGGPAVPVVAVPQILHPALGCAG